jgi:hypothetical protein
MYSELDPINLPYGVFGWTYELCVRFDCHSNFICNETYHAFYFTACRILVKTDKNIMDYTRTFYVLKCRKSF